MEHWSILDLTGWQILLFALMLGATLYLIYLGFRLYDKFQQTYTCWREKKDRTAYENADDTGKVSRRIRRRETAFAVFAVIFWIIIFVFFFIINMSINGLL